MAYTSAHLGMAYLKASAALRLGRITREFKGEQRTATLEGLNKAYGMLVSTGGAETFARKIEAYHTTLRPRWCGCEGWRHGAVCYHVLGRMLIAAAEREMQATRGQDVMYRPGAGGWVVVKGQGANVKVEASR